MSGEPWQYWRFSASWENGRWQVKFPDKPGPMALDEALDLAGSLGWELVGVVPDWTRLWAEGNVTYGGVGGYGSGLFKMEGGNSCELIQLYFKRRTDSVDRETVHEG